MTSSWSPQVDHPGTPDEVRDGGFIHGGWSFPFGDEDFGAAPAALRLVSATTTSTGVIIATYQPAGPVQHGSYALDDA